MGWFRAWLEKGVLAVSSRSRGRFDSAMGLGNEEPHTSPWPRPTCTRTRLLPQSPLRAQLCPLRVRGSHHQGLTGAFSEEYSRTITLSTHEPQVPLEILLKNPEEIWWWRWRKSQELRAYINKYSLSAIVIWTSFVKIGHLNETENK